MFQVFPVHSPEATTEIVVWKRYKDFNKLHKTLSLLHKNLHRPGVFPDFPKPRLFGELVVDHSHTHEMFSSYAKHGYFCKFQVFVYIDPS